VLIVLLVALAVTTVEYVLRVLLIAIATTAAIMTFADARSGIELPTLASPTLDPLGAERPLQK
jgi:hypothetical protein